MEVEKMIRKPKRGYYSEKECWDLYIYLARDIAKALKSFKKANKNSYPGNLANMEAWHEILNKMIYSFETISKDNADVYNNEDKVLEGLDLFSKYYMDLWD